MHKSAHESQLQNKVLARQAGENTNLLVEEVLRLSTVILRSFSCQPQLAASLLQTGHIVSLECSGRLGLFWHRNAVNPECIAASNPIAQRLALLDLGPTISRLK